MLIRVKRNDIKSIETSYQWNIYLECKAGGTYNPGIGLNQHLNGKVDTFTYFLTGPNSEHLYLCLKNTLNPHKMTCFNKFKQVTSILAEDTLGLSVIKILKDIM